MEQILKIAHSNTGNIFDQEVGQSFNIYNGLFLTLPFEGLADAGVQLPQFFKACEEGLADNKTPNEILTGFFKGQSTKEMMDACFRFLQLIERQVVLFDAIEDANFEKLHDVNGPGTLTYLLRQIEGSGKRKEFLQILEQQRVRIVLTAHPTQFYRSSVLTILNDLNQAIQGNDLHTIHNLLLQMGYTRFKNSEKPTPVDEAKSLIWYLVNVFYPTIPEIQMQLEKGVEDHHRTPALELGFWPGGDRDGNPFVTSETTHSVAHLLKNRLLHLYVNEVRDLRRRLSFPDIDITLREIEHRLLDNLLLLQLDLKKSNREENLPTHAFESAEELLEELLHVRKILIDTCNGLFVDQLDQWIVKIRQFGFHFATLDLRQDSSVISAVFLEWLDDPFFRSAKADIPDAKAYLKLSEDDRIKAIKEILKLKTIKHNEERLSDIGQDTFDTLRVAMQIQKENGHRGLERFIISNTQSAQNLWELIALCHGSGNSFNNLSLNIVPLFETVDDMNASEAIMSKLYDDPDYRKNIDRHSKQMIMLGFSDGTKDGGYFTANWKIYRCKVMLSRLSKEKGVNVTFFDGRGGPPARGGGNTHAFYRAMSKEVSQDELQLTIQGQTISSNFGTITAARYNLEQLLTAGFEHHLMDESENDLSKEEFEIIEKLSELSHQAYSDLKNHEKFTPYLEEMTPLRFYSELNFASRPTKRSKSTKLKFEDLRAIPFVGSWTQMKQNVPGFYGLGTAIATLDLEKQLPALRKLYQRSNFIKTLFENALMTLIKTNLKLTSHMQNDPEFGEFYEKIESETNRTITALLSVNKQKAPMDSEPIIRSSIQKREGLILPLVIIQHYALFQLREHKIHNNLPASKVKELTSLILKAMAASINASRNSA